MGGTRSTYGQRRSEYRVSVGKSVGKAPLRRTRRRCEDNIRMDLQKVELGAWTGLNWLSIQTGDRLL